MVTFIDKWGKIRIKLLFKKWRKWEGLGGRTLKSFGNMSPLNLAVFKF